MSGLNPWVTEDPLVVETSFRVDVQEFDYQVLGLIADVFPFSLREDEFTILDFLIEVIIVFTVKGLVAAQTESVNKLTECRG